MEKDIFSRIGSPYDKMKSLENVDGYEQFVKFIEERMGINNDWKVEIKALFEINKRSHPLVEICSQKQSEPEGIFKINSEFGIIETAFVRYVVNQSEAKRKLTNKVKNWLKPLSKYLTGKYKGYEILVHIFSFDVEPTDEELKKIRDDLSDVYNNEGKNFMKIDRFGIIMLFPKNEFPSLQIPKPELSLRITRSGDIVRTYNIELNEKIQQLLKHKRRQHRLKYGDNLRVYYFFIDCPVTRIREIDEEKVLKGMKNKEIAVIFALSDIRGRLVENKKIITRFDENNYCFDFSNKYYSS